MQGVLLRVGCDLTKKGGRWNPPCRPSSWDYAYVPIPEGIGYRHISDPPTYAQFESAVRRLRCELPHHLSSDTKVHVDPDFQSLSIGEPFYVSRGLSSRGRILSRLHPGDFIAFYSSFRPTSPLPDRFAYCLIGLFVVNRVTRVSQLTIEERIRCAHGRREKSSNDLVVWGSCSTSGRFTRAIPIGEYQQRAYRVTRELLKAWGGLTVNDGYIQRSAIPPRFLAPAQFLGWLKDQEGVYPLLRYNG
jgi:hypothetical protein